MAATGAHMNVLSTEFVVNTTTYTLTKVTVFGNDKGISTKKLSGDGDRFPTVSVNDFSDPSITLGVGNITPLINAPEGVEGTLTIVVGDARNLDGAGALTVTMANAKIEEVQMGAQHREYAAGTVKFGCRSADGTTNPVTTSFAS